MKILKKNCFFLLSIRCNKKNDNNNSERVKSSGIYKGRAIIIEASTLVLPDEGQKTDESGRDEDRSLQNRRDTKMSYISLYIRS